jgi:NTE family protein
MVSKDEDVGLVLSGGGARAAYQVGALQAIAELLGNERSPFTVLAGLSAGAINSVALASHADDFRRAVRDLTDTWLSLTPEAVYRTELFRLGSLGMRWFKDLTTGGVLGSSRANYLLDTAPLRAMLKKRVDFSRIPGHIESGALRGVAVSATNYLTGTIVTFFDGAPGLEPWMRHDRIALRETITLDHVLASAAIPIFFPPVSIGGRTFGDGGVRMTTPLSPAIHLGAKKILAIGIRYARTSAETVSLNRQQHAERVSLAQIAGVLLNAVFLDSLDNDLERLLRINRTLTLLPEELVSSHPDRLRPIPALSLKPSRDLGRLAADEYHRFPAVLRHLLRGIGATGESGWDLLSYLAFQPGYIAKLVELGYQDTRARREEIDAFLSTPATARAA